MSGWLIFGLAMLGLWAVETVVDGWVKRSRRSACNCRCACKDSTDKHGAGGA